MSVMISTWRMSYIGMVKARRNYGLNHDLDQALAALIHDVENDPRFHSVGMGGLPNQQGIIQCDASYMNGTTLAYGACGAVENVVSPFDLAYLLSKEYRFNNFLVGQGAYDYANDHGLTIGSLMDYATWKQYTDRSNQDMTSLKAYDGHDTVCACMVDDRGHCVVGTSTSGFFMKHPGRLGDTPCIGCGFYADDQIGAAAATGMGEAICKGVLSHAVLQRIAQGEEPMHAASTLVAEFTEILKSRYGKTDAISLIVVDKQGRYGVGTNVDFAFVLFVDDQPVRTYVALADPHGCTIHMDDGQINVD